jgi:hypothetical protein
LSDSVWLGFNICGRFLAEIGKSKSEGVPQDPDNYEAYREARNKEGRHIQKTLRKTHRQRVEEALTSESFLAALRTENGRDILPKHVLISSLAMITSISDWHDRPGAKSRSGGRLESPLSDDHRQELTKLKARLEMMHRERMPSAPGATLVDLNN